VRRPRFSIVSIAVIAVALVLDFGSGALAGGASAFAASASLPLDSGIGLIKMGGSSSSSGNNWNQLTNTNMYSVIVVGGVNAPSAGQLPGRSLLYACGVNVPDASWSSTCGVSWTAATANGWILKDASGNNVSYGSSGYYLADVGNPSYQQAWVSAMTSILSSTPGIDGVMIDNVQGSLFTPSPTYPDNASYRAAMQSFIGAVGPALMAKGYYVDVNASMNDTTTSGWQTSFGNQCDGSQAIWWYRQLAPDVNGFTSEYWEMNWDSAGSIRLSGTSSCSQNWDGWERLVAAVQGMGKDFIPITSGTSDSAGVAKSTYLKASFLLDYDGGSSAFVYAAGGPGNYSAQVDDQMGGAAWTLNLGQPVAAKYQVGIGWRRDFTGGTVVIDPASGGSQTFALGGTYLLPDGTQVTSVTLQSGSALILPLASAPATTATTTSATTTTTTATTTTTPPTTTTPTTTTTTPTTTSATTTTTTVTTTPAAQPPTNTRVPAISGRTVVGQTLTASRGSWTGSPTSYAYAWSSCDTAGAHCSPIAGATASTLQLRSAQAGATLVVTVTAANAAGRRSATSSPTGVVKQNTKR